MKHLPQVMNEISDLMGARGTLLTLHASNEEVPVLIYANERIPDQARKAILQRLADISAPEIKDDRCFWSDAAGRHGLVLLLPVEQLDGHARLMISVLFDKPNLERQMEAEQLYHERRPFAVGFFQLWQQSRMLQQRVQSFESVLDQTAIGLVMMNRNGQIVFANQTAEEILAIGDGIGRSNRTLRATNLADGVNLQAAISHATAGNERLISQLPTKAPLIAFHRKKGPPLVAAFLPALVSPVEQGDVATVMYLVDPQIDTVKMLSPLCRLHGLSPVETTLVCYLAAGETISSAAQRMRVKEATARSYLKTVFIKTGTRRQTELVVLMLSSLIRTKREVLQEALTSSESERALGMRI